MFLENLKGGGRGMGARYWVEFLITRVEIRDENHVARPVQGGAL